MPSNRRTAKRRKSDKPPATAIIPIGGDPPAAFELAGEDLFVQVSGRRVAKRGKRGTPEARTWISLDPGITVRDVDENSLVVQFTGLSVVVQ
jgi:hypothetical protein